MYLATQMPLESTASDFWRLVKDNSCVAIVMLNSLDSINSSEVSMLMLTKCKNEHFNNSNKIIMIMIIIVAVTH